MLHRSLWSSGLLHLASTWQHSSTLGPGTCVLGSTGPVFNLHDDALEEQVIPMDSPLESDSALSCPGVLANSDEALVCSPSGTAQFVHSTWPALVHSTWTAHGHLSVATSSIFRPWIADLLKSIGIPGNPMKFLAESIGIHRKT
jgi:hypothetical protein